MTLITQAMETSKIMFKNQSFLGRKNTSRKMTALKGFKTMSSVTLNSVQDITLNNHNQEVAKKLKERIHRFLIYSMMLFHSHIIEIASKNPRPKTLNASFGSTTTVLRKYPLVIDHNLMEDKPNTKLVQGGTLATSMNIPSGFEVGEGKEEMGGSPKPGRSSLVRSVSGNEEISGGNDSSFGSSHSNKKLEEPPSLSLNPVRPTFLKDLNRNNGLEMIQEEVEDRNSINDLKKFNETTSKFQKKIETIRESIKNIDSVSEEFEERLRNTTFNVKESKPSKFLTQQDIENIYRKTSGNDLNEEEFLQQEKDDSRFEFEKLQEIYEKKPIYPKYTHPIPHERSQTGLSTPEKTPTTKLDNYMNRMNDKELSHISFQMIPVQNDTKKFPSKETIEKVPKVVQRGMQWRNSNSARGGSSHQTPEITNAVHYAVCKRKCDAIDGDSFTVRQGDVVLLTRIYEKTQLVEVLYNGFNGLFYLKDFEITKEKVNSPERNPQSARKNLNYTRGEEIKGFDENIQMESEKSQQIPKVLLRKRMMENREAFEKSKSKEKKSNVFKERTIVWEKPKKSQDEPANLNYGKIIFQKK